ncbi:MAG: hypothetical protein JNJ90_13170 [Saprospiraceae bacterium]|jgi:hypothetical protein|nr:hypothetical protein [Saprospiraceae bacterium]
MKKTLLIGLASAWLFACQTQSGPWADFVKCGANPCVAEAMAVKDAFLKDPKTLLGQFQETYAKGDDHVVGWLYILRDSMLLNEQYGSTAERYAIQQRIVAAAKAFENDPNLGEMARSVLGEIETLAIISETEDAAEPSGEVFTGTYAYELPGDGGTGELLVGRTAYDKFRFQLTVVGKAPAHNQGVLEGEANIHGNGASFSTTAYGGTCTLEFFFDENTVKIKTTQGDSPTCGFGNGVLADGEFRRKGYDDLFLNGADAEMAKNVQGEWVSATDPKAALKIADGKYGDVYAGEAMGAWPYLFNPKCPANCNPVAPTPCLQVFGQDDVCYAVVKADGKTLHLSQIGGTGNTLVFTRKK